VLGISASVIGSSLLRLLARAHDASLATPTSYLAWHDWALRLEQHGLAETAIISGCERAPQSAELWVRRIQRAVETVGEAAGSSGRATGGSSDRVVSFSGVVLLLKRAVGSVKSAEDVASVWEAVVGDGVGLVSPGTSDWSELVRALEAQLYASAKGPLHGGMGRVAAVLCRSVVMHGGFSALREFYTPLLRCPCPGGDFIRYLVQVEKEAQKEARVGGCSTQLRAVFEAGVASYGGIDVRQWVDYAICEVGGMQGPGGIYWRATKALAEPQEFIDLYRAEIGTLN
jgi:hypothetical protein